MIDVFKKYKESGFLCLPTKKDKSPLLPQNWKNGFDEEYFKDAEGIGLICGEKSGGLECLDFDNHFNDARKNLSAFVDIPEVNEIYRKYKFPIELTMNGGYHFLYRCSKNEGNRKLAQRWMEEQKRPDAIIETRGEGGYFVAYPTIGYKVVRNDIFNPPQISIIERAVLIDSAISMNEYSVPSTISDYEKDERPGDIYNSKSESIHEMKSLLRDAGWVEVIDGKWRRPDKKDGISATLGKVAPNVFYVFSSNAYPFEPLKAYTPFQVLSFLKFNGDFSKAAESLPKPERYLPVAKNKISETELDKILKNSRIDSKKEIERPPIILTIKEGGGGDKNGSPVYYRRVFTLGNFSCIIGKAKSKKTYFLSLVTAALLNERNPNVKISGELPENKRGILYFDTEQGNYDSQNVIRRIIKLAKTEKNLYAYNLRSFTPKERCQIIEYAFKIMGEYIGFCLIDGVADLAYGINEEDEATRVTSMLLRLTKDNNCHIATILHQNKNDNFATGHLGSAIMKKAEIIISVTKNMSDKSRSEVNCDMGRAVDFEPFMFEIDDYGMPNIINEKPPQKDDPAPRVYNEPITIERDDSPF